MPVFVNISHNHLALVSHIKSFHFEYILTYYWGDKFTLVAWNSTDHKAEIDKNEDKRK